MHAANPSFPPELIERLHSGATVAVLSGAGISAASGIPTFRGADGLWKQYRAEELATPEAFARDPETVWEWYGWRRDLVRRAEPNAAHRALADLAHRVASLGIITQNVDGLHRRSGLPQHVEVVELHGSLWILRCTACGEEKEDLRPGPPPGELPRCTCGGLLRPGVVWFGEMLAPESLTRAQILAQSCEILLVVGTSAVVYPAAGFAAVAARAGAWVVDFNLEATPLDDVVHASVQGPCEDTLPALVAALSGD